MMHVVLGKTTVHLRLSVKYGFHCTDCREVYNDCLASHEDILHVWRHMKIFCMGRFYVHEIWKLQVDICRNITAVELSPRRFLQNSFA
jgi:hypothetical protein